MLDDGEEENEADDDVGRPCTEFVQKHKDDSNETTNTNKMSNNMMKRTRD